MFSQLTLRNYWILSALALACCGDAVLPLLGVALELPDAVLSTLGAMNYASFLLLPLGFLLGGKLGAGKSMALENGVMALAVLLTASSLYLGKTAFFAGLLLFLTARAANNAMRFTLQKNIALESEMPAMLARNYIGLHSASLLGCLAVAVIFKLYPADRTIFFVLLAGALLFAAVAWCIRRIKEPLQVKQLAAQPLAGQIKAAWRDSLVRHQIYVGTLLNCFLATVVPINIIAAKQGASASNAMVIMLTAIQAISAVCGSILVREITRRYGPRRMMLAGYPLVWLLCAAWVLLPMRQYPLLMFIPFIAGGLLMMTLGTSLENYFLISVPTALQPGGTFLVFVITGGVAGTLGIFINSIIFKIAGAMNIPSGSMELYRFYFTIAGILFAAGIIAPWSLPVKHHKKDNPNQSCTR